MEILIYYHYIFVVIAASGIAFAFADSELNKLLALKIATNIHIPFNKVLSTISEPKYIEKLISLGFMGGVIYYFFLHLSIIHLAILPLVALTTIILAKKYIFKSQINDEYVSEIVLRLLNQNSQSSNTNNKETEILAITEYLIKTYELDKKNSENTNLRTENNYKNTEDELVGFEKSKFLLRRALKETFGGLKMVLIFFVIILLGAAAKNFFR